MKRTVKAFIFDLDGVITDTAEYHYQAWKRLADEEGLPFDREKNEKLRGVSRRECLRLILNGKKVPEEEMEAMMERKNNYYKELIENVTRQDILPGVKELLTELRASGYKIAIASVSKNAKTVLNGLGIIDLFDAISDGYSVKNSKPAPDLFLHAAEQLGIAPEYCAVVEDAEAGIEGALAANMLAIGIGPKERVGKAHYRHNETKDINLNELLSA